VSQSNDARGAYWVRRRGCYRFADESAITLLDLVSDPGVLPPVRLRASRAILEAAEAMTVEQIAGTSARHFGTRADFIELQRQRTSARHVKRTAAANLSQARQDGALGKLDVEDSWNEFTSFRVTSSDCPSFVHGRTVVPRYNL